MKQSYEIYKNNPRTGSKTMLETVTASTQTEAITKGVLSGAIKAGSRYMVISHSIRAKSTVYVTKEMVDKAKGTKKKTTTRKTKK